MGEIDSVDTNALDVAARSVLSAAVAGNDWLVELEPIMNELNTVGGGPARVVPPNLFGIPSAAMHDTFLAFKKCAPVVTWADVIAAAPADEFVADYTRPTYAQKLRTSLYNDFLQPNGLFHEATAILDEVAEGPVRFLIFRSAKQGRFETDELRTLSRTLPYLRSAAMFARSSLQSGARRQAEPFERRGELVFYLDVDGRVAEANPAAERALGANVNVFRRRLVAAWPRQQARLDRALTAALAERRPGLVTLQGAEHAAPAMALVVPVTGDAKEVFYTTAAFVVLIEPTRRNVADDAAITLLKDAADLTAREIDVVRLVGMGQSPREAADELGIRYGTLRNHLKTGFAKLGVHSQRELVALIQRLR